MSKLEDIARAIYVETKLGGELRGNKFHLDHVFGGTATRYEFWRDQSFAAARAAVEALSPPDEAMIEEAAKALYEQWFPHRDHEGRGGWESELVTDGDTFRAGARVAFTVALSSILNPAKGE